MCILSTEAAVNADTRSTIYRILDISDFWINTNVDANADSDVEISVIVLSVNLNKRANKYYKYIIIREYLSFGNIRELDPMRIQHSREIFAYIEFTKTKQE